MNSESILNNLDLSLLLMKNFPAHSSGLLARSIDKIEDEIITDRLSLLKNDIGKELFNKLSYNDRIFMIETSGSIDFGHSIDFDKLAQYIKDYDNYQE